MENVTKLPCSCGAIYELESERMLLRDTDKLKCEMCGKILKRWRDSRVHFFATLVQIPTER